MTENYDYWRFATNSVITSVTATLLTLIVGVPCAYAMAFNPTRGTKDILMWMLSTKMLPAAAAFHLLQRHPERHHRGGPDGWFDHLGRG